jgi:hypothetical protein
MQQQVQLHPLQASIDATTSQHTSTVHRPAGTYSRRLNSSCSFSRWLLLMARGNTESSLGSPALLLLLLPPAGCCTLGKPARSQSAGVG